MNSVEQESTVSSLASREVMLYAFDDGSGRVLHMRLHAFPAYISRFPLCGLRSNHFSIRRYRPIFVGHGGSLTTEVRRVLFDVSFNVYHHSLGTPVGGQFSYVY
jgi:hypothetical protein